MPQAPRPDPPVLVQRQRVVHTGGHREQTRAAEAIHLAVWSRCMRAVQGVHAHREGVSRCSKQRLYTQSLHPEASHLGDIVGGQDAGDIDGEVHLEDTSGGRDAGDTRGELTGGGSVGNAIALDPEGGCRYYISTHSNREQTRAAKEVNWQSGLGVWPRYRNAVQGGTRVAPHVGCWETVWGGSVGKSCLDTKLSMCVHVG